MRAVTWYMANLAYDLCALILLPPPCMMLAPHHNSLQHVPCNVTWLTYFDQPRYQDGSPVILDSTEAMQDMPAGHAFDINLISNTSADVVRHYALARSAVDAHNNFRWAIRLDYYRWRDNLASSLIHGLVLDPAFVSAAIAAAVTAASVSAAIAAAVTAAPVSASVTATVTATFATAAVTAAVTAAPVSASVTAASFTAAVASASFSTAFATAAIASTITTAAVSAAVTATVAASTVTAPDVVHGYLLKSEQWGL